MHEAEPTTTALRLIGDDLRAARIFLHFFDIHFLEEKGADGFKQQAFAEMRLATRFAVMVGRQVLIPAASHYESPLCQAVLREFNSDIFHSIFRLVGSGANFGEFREDKLRQYRAEQVQGGIYRAASSKLLLPWMQRERSATSDIRTDWISAVRSGDVENLLKPGGAPIARLGERHWEDVPDRLRESAFIPENVFPLLNDGKELPLTTENRIRQFINKSYWKSYALDVGASVVQDMNWLSSPNLISTGDPARDIYFRQLKDATLREKILGEIQSCKVEDLLPLARDERFAVALGASRAVDLHGARAQYYTKIPTEPGKRAKRAVLEKAMEAKILIITALPKERAAVAATMDQVEDFGVRDDPLLYELGTFAPGGDMARARSAIIASPPGMGTNNAAALTSSALRSFPEIKHILMVGIAGGCPAPSRVEDHVRLGDVVFSNEAGILAYDFQKQTGEGVEIRSFPQKPAAGLLQSAKLLEARVAQGQRPWLQIMAAAAQKLSADYVRPATATDVLYNGDTPVAHPVDSGRIEGQPRIHGGGIAAADTLQKDSQKRDLLRDEYGSKAIEMEASGIQSAGWLHDRDVFVVRGICDYCDKHKNNDWQGYAALAAAGFSRALLELLPDEWFSSRTPDE